MSTIDSETVEKIKDTYWIEAPVLEDIKKMAKRTGKTKTAIIHESVRLYKDSQQYQDAIAKHRLEVDDPSSSKGQSLPPKVKTFADAATKSGLKKSHKQSGEK